MRTQGNVMKLSSVLITDAFQMVEVVGKARMIVLRSYRSGGRRKQLQRLAVDRFLNGYMVLWLGPVLLEDDFVLDVQILFDL